ncbi:hypothetical protein HOP50_05g37550 [Chloropicon primus]|uniref:C2 domain-containing protein n=2 Tax=Chloropicon primus TaxID=1764295 RepID=A0A5B8ML74_9CHLO|nr:hypothetical protein A3770_05p37450 [Chloropicon primus]UPR00441.1 hypothetical protein HOP50_05g37550 [Chloropicon primus]|eukprot:QDZ21227.1 hypothetical protein A3770_05p37450 [Chloropicon primus]
MEDDESLERQKEAIMTKVEELEEASGVTKEREMEAKLLAFNESMAHLKEQRLDLLKQRAKLTQEMEKRGFSARVEDAGFASSADLNRKKFTARENLITRLIEDSRSSQKLVDRLKRGESVEEARRHVEQDERREAKRKERLRREKEAQELREAKRRTQEIHDQRERDKEAKAERMRSSKLSATSGKTRRRSSVQVAEEDRVPSYVRELQAQIKALQEVSLGNASKARGEETKQRARVKMDEDVEECDEDLPKPIQRDSEMIQLHKSHMREMLKLQYEMERMQREVELEKMRTEISKLRDEKEHPRIRTASPTRGLVARGLLASGGPQQQEHADHREEADPPPSSNVVRAHAKVLGPPGAFPLSLVKESLEQPAASPLPPAETYTITINMNRMMTTNFMLQGKVRVTAQIYDGVQLQEEALSPGPTEAGTVTGEASSTSYVFPVYSESTATNFFTWRDKLTIPGVQINPASQVVLEIQTILEVQREEDEEKEEGWDKLKKMYSKGSTFNLPQVVCWAMIPLVNQETNQHIEGHQTIPVYHLPKILGSAGKQSAMKGTSLELDVNITKQKVGRGELADLEKRTLSSQSVGGPSDASGSKRRPSSEERRTMSKSRDVSSIPPEAWVRSRRALQSLETFQPGDGFVIRVDAGRFFPENVTATKITVRFLTSEREQVGDNIESIGSLDASAYSPRYRLRCFVNTEYWDDPTVMALLTVETLEKNSEEFCVVGYACLPIFLDPDTEKQPKPDHAGDYTLRSGSYQIPLHNCLPPQEASAHAFSKEMDRNKNDLETTKVALASFDEEAFQEHCPRISCASLLVRILTPEEDDLVMLRGDRLPEYGSMEYDTRQSEPIECEKLMYPFKLKTRSFLSTSELLKKSFFTDDEIQDLEEDDREGGGNMLMEWVRNRLQRPDLKNDVMINYGHSFTYLDKLGFSVAVDGAKNLVKGLPAFAFVSLNPPGAFYENSGRMANAMKVTEDVAFMFRHDPKGKGVCPVWEDGLIRFPFVPYDPYLCVVIEVRYWNAKSSRLTTIGWTALPVFYKGHGSEQHVCTGYYNLPLFMGSPSFSFLESMWSTHFPEVAKTGLEQARLRIAKEAPSVLVRLVDNQREGEMAEPATNIKVKSKLKIPHFVPRKYAGAMQKEARGRKLYEKMKPRKAESYLEWRAEMAERVSQSSGVAYAKETMDAELEEDRMSRVESAPPSPTKTLSRATSRSASRAPSVAGDAADKEGESEEESEYSEEESEEED